MSRSARRLGWAAAVVTAALACAQDLTAPGRCPFCAGGGITVTDTVLFDAVLDDSAFRGYVRPHEAGVLLTASLPNVESRAWFRLLGLPYGYAGDTLRDSILAVDSLSLTVYMAVWDTGARNLTVHLHRLPLTLALDSTTTYADLEAAFADPPIRSLNVAALFALPGSEDSVRRDRIFRDSAGVLHTLVMGLDSAEVPIESTDSGRVAFGIRITAATLPYIAFVSSRAGFGPRLDWHLRVDPRDEDPPVVDTLTYPSGVDSRRDGFVFDRPSADTVIDSTLAVGGVPAARSLLRFDLDRGLLDSTQVLRATLVLLPAAAPQGVPADSFLVFARAVVSDLGAKSPIAQSAVLRDSARVRIGSTDTVRIGVTNIVRLWAADTAAPLALMLVQQPEGASFAEARFYPSGAGAFRPRLEIVYSPRFPFGAP